MFKNNLSLYEVKKMGAGGCKRSGVVKTKKMDTKRSIIQLDSTLVRHLDMIASITTESIYVLDVVQGREQTPCKDCIYQW